MKAAMLIGGLAGAGLAAWLLESYGLSRILATVARAGWLGALAVVAFHLVQVLFSAAAWREIAGPAAPRPTLSEFVALRWIREGVNNLLPVAQVGGEFVAVRLLQRRGVKLAAAAAGTVADLTVETITQVAFTLLGLGLLLQSAGSAGIAGYVASGAAVGALLAGGFLGAQRFGAATLVERAATRLGAALGWAGAAEIGGLHDALLDCWRSPRRVSLAVLHHSVSWLLGGLEVCLALHLLGHDVGLVPGLAIESLGQALKAAGFAVPGAVGVQEGGYVIVCGAYGLAPEVALALSLLKRLREVALGVPALLAWQRREVFARSKAPAAMKLSA